MQDLHQLLNDSCISPLFVVPVDRRVGWEIFGQVLPIASILEAIEDAIEDIPIVPLERASPFLWRKYLEQPRFENVPFFISEAAGI
jgi:hypothetical protein